MRRTWRWLMAVGLLATTGAAAAEPPSEPGGYAILGLEAVTLRRGVRVEGGDVGCNAEAGRITLADGARVSGLVAASTIRLGPRVRTAQLFCTLLAPSRPLDVVCEAVSVPLVRGRSLPLVHVDPGVEDVRLPRFASRQALPARAYAAVRVGPRARLVLAGGAYAFRSVAVGRKGEILCREACTIRVAERAVFGAGSRLGAEPPLDARAVRLEVKGGGPRPVVQTRAGVVLDGTVYAPNGGVSLGPGGRYTGAFVGRQVVVRRRAQVTAASAL